MPQARVNQYERAFRAWPLLTDTAAQRSTITYAALSAALVIHSRPIRYVLGVIQDWCLHEKKPPLTILVVSQSSHRPGHGFIAWEANDLREGYEQVYGFPWSDLANPFAFAAQGATPEGLAHRLVVSPDSATEVYRQVKNRGFAQVVFRLALLAAYRQRCAFCDLSLRNALQAAHIIPWHVATVAQRMSPSNGLLLRATHHALFLSSTQTNAAPALGRIHPSKPSAMLGVGAEAGSRDTRALDGCPPRSAGTKARFSAQEITSTLIAQRLGIVRPGPLHPRQRHRARATATRPGIRRP